MTKSEKLYILIVAIVCLSSCILAGIVTHEPLMGFLVFMGYVIALQKTVYERKIQVLKFKLKEMKGN